MALGLCFELSPSITVKCCRARSLGHKGNRWVWDIGQHFSVAAMGLGLKSRPGSRGKWQRLLKAYRPLHQHCCHQVQHFIPELVHCLHWASQGRPHSSEVLHCSLGLYLLNIQRVHLTATTRIAVVEQTGQVTSCLTNTLLSNRDSSPSHEHMLRTTCNMG